MRFPIISFFFDLYVRCFLQYCLAAKEVANAVSLKEHYNENHLTLDQPGKPLTMKQINDELDILMPIKLEKYVKGDIYYLGIIF